MACALIAARQAPTLVLVYRTPLLEQWRNELTRTLGLDHDRVGQLGGGRDARTGMVDVTTFQTLAKRDDLAELARDDGLVVIDECHHVPAVTIQTVVSQLPGRYLLGVTATPYRQDGLEVHDTAFRVTDDGAPIQQVLGAVAEDVGRSRQVARDVAAEVAAGRRCLVLTERKKHLALLAGQLRACGLEPVELHGGLR